MNHIRSRKKLIEVALPLDAINAASAREKSIRHGHPSTLHLWWARRPLAAARAVLFAQLVDDPSAWPELFPTAEAQHRERERLFAILKELVQWENTTNEEVLERARCEIRRSWARYCLGGTAAERLSDDEIAEAIRTGQIPPLPGVHDPFAGGGSIPLEAQRLGLAAYASDLNPVAVTINKAMIEIPPRFRDCLPVNPQDRQRLDLNSWYGAQGLAADVRYYGQWMREQAQRRIGHLYPPITITAELAADRANLRSLIGQQLTVIAWLWARTVRSPNPAFAHVEVPLVTTFILSSKPGHEAYVEPVVEGDTYHFTVRVGKPPEWAKQGTKLGGGGSSFFCLLSKIPIGFDYIRSEAMKGRMGQRLMAIVAEGSPGRVYLPPTAEHESIAKSALPSWKPETPLPEKALGFRVQLYGMKTYADLFTPRQLVALTTFADLVGEAMECVRRDAQAAGLPDDGVGLNDGGTGATAYAQAVGVYLAFVVSRLADFNSTVCGWIPVVQATRNTFARQAIPMTWDFAEINLFGDWLANVNAAIEKIIYPLNESFPLQVMNPGGSAMQADAQTQTISANKIISTDPPYYDNIGYADLSDFFYVWLRRTLRPIFPDLYATLSPPKAEELVATPYRHGSKQAAERFFMDGMTRALHNLVGQAHPAFPVTIYYAFKQQEVRDAQRVAGATGELGDPDLPSSLRSAPSSTGWETFLEAVIQAGFAVTGTWPMRTELGNRILSQGTNALASSIVLVCRPRPADAPIATRREFLAALKAELPAALAALQHANIAPVDLAQAAIGPGMAVYTRSARVVDAQGNPVRVREALAQINQVLDEVLAEQEGDFDADTRWALAWFEQYGFAEGEYGVAETLSKAKNTSVEGLVAAGMVEAKRGKVRLLAPAELPAAWDPAGDSRVTHWEAVHHLIRVLNDGGELAAAALAAKLGSRADVARELAYRLYTICERKKRPDEAFAYNALVQSWSEIARLMYEQRQSLSMQQAMDL
jgi:putative DNA methylase